MRIHRTRTVGIALTLAAGLMVAGCSNPNANPPDDNSTTSAGPTDEPEPDPDPTEPTPDPTTDPPPLDPEAVQAAIDEVIFSAVDVEASGWSHEADLNSPTYGDHFIDESTGEPFDDMRIARRVVFYESPGWAPGDSAQFMFWFEIVRLDSTRAADRLINTITTATVEEASIESTDESGGRLIFEYVPEPASPRSEFSSTALVRGIRVVWANGLRTDGLTGYETAGPYAISITGVSMPDQNSVDALDAFLDDHLAGILAEFRTLSSAP